MNSLIIGSRVRIVASPFPYLNGKLGTVTRLGMPVARAYELGEDWQGIVRIETDDRYCYETGPDNFGKVFVLENN